MTGWGWLTATFVLVASSSVWMASARANELHIDADFPGGNIVVEKIAGDDVYVHQDLRDTRGDWFYWCFRVRGAEGRELTFHFTKSKAIGLLGPAMSGDGGASWRWLGRRESPTAFTYRFAPGENNVRFGFGMAYVDANLQQFLATHHEHPALKREVFAHTKKGTPVEMLRLGRAEGAARYKVLVTARHHACEMMASYVAEGIVAGFLGDSDAARWLQQNVECVVVPLVDRDGVEAGDQGKNRLPHDHKADYRGPSIYPEVAALRAFTAKWTGGKADVAFDLHNPAIDGDFIYTHALRTEGVTQPGENAGGRNRTLAQKFLETLERVQRGLLRFRVQDSIDFAERMAQKKTGRPAVQVESRREEVAANAAPRPRITIGFEIPYAQVRGVEVNPDSARALGRDIAVALAAYVKELDAARRTE